jgi:hypothetical protein
MRGDCWRELSFDSAPAAVLTSQQSAVAKVSMASPLHRQGLGLKQWSGESTASV